LQELIKKITAQIDIARSDKNGPETKKIGIKKVR
jgi:hypothetical protein